MHYRIKEIREKLQLKQTKLAEKSGVSRQTINGLETGYIEVTTTETLEKIANALNVKIEDLFLTPVQTEYAVPVKNLESNMNGIIRNIEEIKKDLRKQLALLAEAVQKTDYGNGDEAICEAFEETARELARWGSLAAWLQR